MIKVGDWVTQYSTGYWQVLEIIPKYADEDYSGDKISWKKGGRLGDWAVLKKACTLKMKPANRCECVDFSWCHPVAPEVVGAIDAMFLENPKAKAKFDKAPNRPEPYVASEGMLLSEE